MTLKKAKKKFVIRKMALLFNDLISNHYNITLSKNSNLTYIFFKI